MLKESIAAVQEIEDESLRQDLLAAMTILAGEMYLVYLSIRNKLPEVALWCRCQRKTLRSRGSAGLFARGGEADLYFTEEGACRHPAQARLSGQEKVLKYQKSFIL
jgi:hypothetical protein